LQTDILDVYQQISHNKTFRERANVGTRGDLIELENHQIIKADKVGEQSTAWEFQVLIALESLGITPKPVQEKGIFGYPDTFQMEKIDNGATFQEYLEAFLLGNYTPTVFINLCRAIGQMLNKFWEAGWVHGDLHGDNIVIDIDSDQLVWMPYLIDFGTTFHHDCNHPLGQQIFAERKMTRLDELPEPGEDLDVLSGIFTLTYNSIATEDNQAYWEGLEILKRQVSVF
jgi:tRNA A-37 threonylcarbamoyl transferase component Bud32